MDPTFSSAKGSIVQYVPIDYYIIMSRTDASHRCEE